MRRFKEPLPNADLRKAIPQGECPSPKAGVPRVWVTSDSCGYPIGEYEVVEPRQVPRQDLYIDTYAAARLLERGEAQDAAPEAERPPAKKPTKKKAVKDA